MKFKRILLFFALLLFLSGCSGQTTTSTSTGEVETYSGATSYPVIITDMSGDVTIDEKPERIVSLSPSNTEILFAIGAGDQVVGRTNYCNYPPEAEKVESIGDYATPSVEKILSLSPDLVMATDFIADDVKSQIEATGAKVLVFSPATIDEVENSITSIGQAVDQNDGATTVVENMQSQYDDLKAKLDTKDVTKTVFIDLGDYYTVGPGSLLNDELTLIDAENIAADADASYPQLSVETIVSDDPDVYISFLNTADQLKQVSGFSTMKCFEDNEVFYYPDTSTDADVMKRPGPRVIEGMQLLAKDIYPEVFND